MRGSGRRYDNSFKMFKENRYILICEYIMHIQYYIYYMMYDHYNIFSSTNQTIFDTYMVIYIRTHDAPHDRVFFLYELGIHKYIIMTWFDFDIF